MLSIFSNQNTIQHIVKLIQGISPTLFYCLLIRNGGRRELTSTLPRTKRHCSLAKWHWIAKLRKETWKNYLVLQAGDWCGGPASHSTEKGPNTKPRKNCVTGRENGDTKELWIFYAWIYKEFRLEKISFPKKELTSIIFNKLYLVNTWAYSFGMIARFSKIKN